MRTLGNRMIFSPYVADVLLIVFLMYVKSERCTLSRKSIKRVADFKIAAAILEVRPLENILWSCFFEIELYPDIYDFII